METTFKETLLMPFLYLCVDVPGGSELEIWEMKLILNTKTGMGSKLKKIFKGKLQTSSILDHIPVWVKKIKLQTLCTLLYSVYVYDKEETFIFVVM